MVFCSTQHWISVMYHGCYVCDMFVATAEVSTNMLHVLSALRHVFDAILFMLCLALMVASWPTGSPTLEKERDPICCHQGSLHFTGLERLPLPPSNPHTHRHGPISCEQEGGHSAIYSTLDKKYCCVVISFPGIKTEWFSCFLVVRFFTVMILVRF